MQALGRRVPRGLLGLLALTMIMVGLLPNPGAAAQPKRASADQPYVSGVETVPTYSYASALRQTVYVQAPFDGDKDGKPDRVAVDIVRPVTPTGVKVPVIMDASPYYACCGRGNESEKKTYDASGNLTKMPLYLDNYFVPRGYAVAGVDLAGTNRSTGCNDMGGPSDIGSAKAVIDWLNGRVTGYTTLTGTTAVTAADWTTGSVGMIGKSWDGTIANGVAATGVAGLKTIVPISAISSWYDYARYNGVIRTTLYTNYLENLVNSRGSTCTTPRNNDQTASDDTTGNYNTFWTARNYRPNAAQVKASVFLVHGINDLNVSTGHFGNWWPALAANNVPRKIWLSQDGHVDPFDFRRDVWVDTLHRWFDYWLQDLPNGIMTEQQATIQRADGTWVDEASWPAATGTTSVALSTLGGAAKRTVVDNTNLTEATAVAKTASSTQRALFLSGTLTQSLRVSGNATVQLQVKLTKGTSATLSARLVDYGSQRRVDYLTGEGATTGTTESCYGDSTATDDGCYKNVTQNFITSDTDILTRGWLDASHYASKDYSTRETLVTNKSYAMTVPLNTTDAVIPAGHQLGVVITLADKQYTSRGSTSATVEIDPALSTLNLPTTGGTVPTPTSAAQRQITRTDGARAVDQTPIQQKIYVPLG